MESNLTNLSTVRKGEVHTAGYCAKGFIDHQGILSCTSTKRNKATGDYDTSFRFNPNSQFAPCGSYQEYKSRLANLLRVAGVEVKPSLIRLDFKFDHTESERDTAQWLKMWELMVYCFAAYKNIKPKGRMRTVDPFTGEHKSTKATTKGFEIEVYNKAIQKPDEGIDYRAEIRRKNIPKGDESDALRQWERIIAKLPAYYDAACEALTDRLADEWKVLDVDGHFKLNQHIYTNSSMIYNREQVRAIYQKIGCTDAGQAASNFMKRYPLLMISKQELTDFCGSICGGIQAYLVGQA
ncbi:MAG: hypothetical protein PHE09_17745 [Oscillospiraceae bacterium]|nr:hypothetical protein [Oscillospiraceae bacterium]